jgi:hypothetical protein
MKKRNLVYFLVLTLCIGTAWASAEVTIYVDPDSACYLHTPCYSKIQDAIDSVVLPSTIKILQVSFYEDVVLDTNKIIVLEGGCDYYFTSCSSHTIISGPMTISDGTMIIGGAGSIVLSPIPTLIVFASSLLYNGNLGGVAGADAKCQALATQAGLPGTYKAWISGMVNDDISAPEFRFTTLPFAYKRVDGQLFVNSAFGGTYFGLPVNPLNIDENGNTVPLSLSINVWTNTGDHGEVLAVDDSRTCNQWTFEDSQLNGYGGYADEADWKWTGTFDTISGALLVASCGQLLRLYCFQQP